MLKRGLVRSIGNGRDTLVWIENWIIDEFPRSLINLPRIIDFMLRVSDLIDPQTGKWKTDQSRQIFGARDADYILKLIISPLLLDIYIWSFSKDGRYNS